MESLDFTESWEEHWGEAKTGCVGMEVMTRGQPPWHWSCRAEEAVGPVLEVLRCVRSWGALGGCSSGSEVLGIQW